jgi:hypothetical protein
VIYSEARSHRASSAITCYFRLLDSFLLRERQVMKNIRGYQSLRIAPAICSFVLAFSLGTYAQQVQANQPNSEANAGEAERLSAPGRAPEMEKLAKMLVGNWDVVATLESSSARPRGRKDAGANRIVLGPGGRSVVENYHTDGDSGSRSALGILWWDEKAQGYRTMFCDNADPAGCSVYDGLGRWEGNDLIFKFRRYRGNDKIDAKEVITPTSPISFTVRFFETRNDGPEDVTWTVTNTKAN